jgi:putative ABC transport system permease protein
MRRLRAWCWRFAALFHKEQRDLELAEELESHLQMHIEDNLRCGMNPVEARRQAIIKLGGVEQAKENYRERRGIRWFETLLQDARFGLRLLRKNPGFTAVAVLTLAVGVGATTAIFTVVNAVLIRPLPFKNPSSLVMVWENSLGLTKSPFSAPDFSFLQRSQTSFEAMGAFQKKEFEISGNGQPERVMAARVSASVFPMLGIEPILGRTFTAEEDAPGSNVVLMSYGLWQRRYGGAKDITGRSINLDRQSYTIVGVMPQSFDVPVGSNLPGLASSHQPVELWLPMAFTPDELQGWGNMYNNSVIARLKPHTTLAQAGNEAELLSTRLTSIYPPAVMKAFNGQPFNLVVYPFQEDVVGPVREPLLVLMTAAGLVLLIACANVATLLLSRAATRRREIAVRTALGATRARLLRQLLTESLLLAASGGALGFMLARWGIKALLALVPPEVPLPPHQVSLGDGTFAFVVGVSILTAVLFGLAPALQISSLPLQHGLQEGGRSATPGRAQQRLRGLFVTMEFAMALVLLISAGLLIRSFAKLLETDPGFRPERVLTMNLPLPYNAYPKAAQIREFYQRLLEQTESLPGIAAVGFANDLPLENREITMFQMENGNVVTNRSLGATWVLGDYFQATGIALLQGRWITTQDRRDSQPVAMVSQTLARQFWPNEDAVGKRIRWGTGPPMPWLTVVGVVRDVNDRESGGRFQARVYMPYSQMPDGNVEENVVGEWRSLNLAIRTQRDPEPLATAVVGRIRSLDPNLAAAHIRTMTQVASSSVAGPRFNTLLLGIFGGVGMFLAVIGVYGVLAYMVTEQTHEIGIRIALGAQRSDVFRLVLGQGLKLALIGIGIGLAASFGLTRLMASQLYGLSATDPLTFAAVAIVLAFVALLACYIPARRATRVDPMVALRHE